MTQRELFARLKKVRNMIDEPLTAKNMMRALILIYFIHVLFFRCRVLIIYQLKKSFKVICMLT